MKTPTLPKGWRMEDEPAAYEGMPEAKATGDLEAETAEHRLNVECLC